MRGRLGGGAGAVCGGSAVFLTGYGLGLFEFPLRTAAAEQLLPTNWRNAAARARQPFRVVARGEVRAFMPCIETM
eukprot:364809-Chlamydomonas_euryale.AAC.21